MVKVRQSKSYQEPKVFATQDAYEDMLAITRAADGEVGWFCRVERPDEGSFVITDVYLPEQEANGGTTEIQGETLHAFALAHLEEHGEEEYNLLRGWGHSHGSMGLTPSSQDQTTIDELCAGIGEPFVAVRSNQTGGFQVDVAFPSGTTYEGMPLYIGWADPSRAAFWKEEIKQKVRPKTYKGKGLASSSSSSSYQRSSPSPGKWVRDLSDGVWKRYQDCKDPEPRNSQWQFNEDDCPGHDWIEFTTNDGITLTCSLCDAEVEGDDATTLSKAVADFREQKISLDALIHVEEQILNDAEAP